MRPNPPESLGRFFAGLTEHAFVSRLGVADPPLIDYVTGMLVRFVRTDIVYRIRDLTGRRLEEVALMMVEAEERLGEARREVHRHVGDFALFWTGLYPEALGGSKTGLKDDFFVHYCEQGKRSYYIASTIPADDDDENKVLRRLSHEFEMCVYGLGEVRREWERREPGDQLPLAS